MLPRSRAARAATAQRLILLHPDWSDRRIAGASGLDSKAVAALRGGRDSAAPTRRLGRDGRTRPLRSAEGRSRAAALMQGDPSLSLREVARQADISVGTARDVRQRLGQGMDPVPAGQREVAAADEDTGPPTDALAQEEYRRILARLARDPSLRYNYAGKALLRLLIGHCANIQSWQRLAAAVPSYSAEAVIALARTCAADWAGLAEQIEVLLADAPVDPADPGTGRAER